MPIASSASSSGWKLRPQGALDAFSGLVPRPQVVTERLDDVIRRHADVGRALLHHLQDRLQHPDDTTKRPVLALREPAQAVEVAEQLVGAVDDVDDHPRIIQKLP
jgi:hypothetical protein